MTSKFDVIVVGNGVIGSLIAYELSHKNSNLKIAIIGPENRHNSASAAAGAMINVFAEMEFPYSKSSAETIQKYLRLGMDGAQGWLDFLTSRSLLDSVVTAKDTLVFLKNEASDFEKLNFKEMIRVAVDHKVYEDYSVDRFSTSLPLAGNTVHSVAKLKGEFALDSAKLLMILENLLKENSVTTINEIVKNVNYGLKPSVVTESGEYSADKVVLAAGANTEKLLPGSSLVPMLQGVGSAFLFRTTKSHMPEVFRKNVIRTVNRGGAQCGFHVVPRLEGFYLGAGNYITVPSESSHRLETLRYLFQTLETELIGNSLSYDLVGSLVKGHRPRSLDGLPMIGSMHEAPNIFVATATNRAGLTWAPSISSEVQEWLLGNDISTLYKGWEPDRKLTPFGAPEEALLYFVESRIGAALEHNLIPNDYSAIQTRKEELHKLGSDLLSQTRDRLNTKEFVSHPDHWGPILENDFSCFK